MTKRRVTLRDIAGRAQVSIQTVSRALRGAPKVSAAKRAEIRRLSEEMGYTPDPMLTALAAYRRQRRTAHYTETVAFVWIAEGPVRGSGRSSLAGMVEQRLGQLGYKMEAHALEPDAGRQLALDRLLRNRGIRAAIIHPGRHPAKAVRLDWKRLAAMWISAGAVHPFLSTIAADYYENAHLACEKVAQGGCGVWRRAASHAIPAPRRWWRTRGEARGG